MRCRVRRVREDNCYIASLGILRYSWVLGKGQIVELVRSGQMVGGGMMMLCWCGEEQTWLEMLLLGYRSSRLF